MKTVFLSLLQCLLLFIFCFQTDAQSASSDWIAEPPKEVREQEGASMWPQVARQDRILVLKCQRSRALQMLRSTPFVALDSRKLKFLTGLQKQRGYYYLIRSLQFREGTAGLFLGWKNQQLWSSAGVMAAKPHLEKRPFVVRTSKPLKKLYTTAEVFDHVYVTSKR